MKIRLKLLLILALIFLMQPEAFSQVSGFAGKRFILKSDGASYALEKGYGGELEVVIGRNFSLALDLRTMEKTIDIFFRENYRDRGISTFKATTLGLASRRYLNDVFPAPKGPYVLWQLRYGRVDIDKFTYDDNQYRFGYSNFTAQENIFVRNAHFGQIAVGTGYQSIFFSRLVLDIGWKFTMSYTEAGKAHDLIGDEVSKFGANLIDFSSSDSFGDYSNLGISAYFAFGFLLF